MTPATPVHRSAFPIARSGADPLAHPASRNVHPSSGTDRQFCTRSRDPKPSPPWSVTASSADSLIQDLDVDTDLLREVRAVEVLAHRLPVPGCAMLPLRRTERRVARHRRSRPNRRSVRRGSRAHMCRSGAPNGPHLLTFGARVRCASCRSAVLARTRPVRSRSPNPMDDTNAACRCSREGADSSGSGAATGACWGRRISRHRARCSGSRRRSC
jgi:hypothetical protein